MYYVKITNISRSEHIPFNGTHLGPFAECYMNEIGQLSTNPVPITSTAKLIATLSHCVEVDKILHVQVTTGGTK